MFSKEIITAPRANAIIPPGVVDSPFACGAFIFESMKEIRLSNGMMAMVDDDMSDSLNQYHWWVQKSRNTYYAVRNARLNGRAIQIRMHRQVMDTPKGMQVDHIDHNGLNCQRLNMRNCTLRQNVWNRSAQGVSKYLGVSTKTTKWRDRVYFYIIAQIKTNGKVKHLGCFKSEEEAARAYDKKAKELFGEFANINFKD